jgi:hypothetical protein
MVLIPVTPGGQTYGAEPPCWQPEADTVARAARLRQRSLTDSGASCRANPDMMGGRGAESVGFVATPYWN